jgi:hypothetical protein
MRTIASSRWQGASTSENRRSARHPERLIRAPGEGAGSGMPEILLGSKNGRRRLERTGASHKTTPAPKSLSGRAAGGDALNLGQALNLS